MKNDFLKIRKTHKDDWESIKKIYTLGLNTGVASFETEVSKTYEDWFKKFDKENVFVGEIEKEIVGWITLSKVSSRCCYEGVGEVSIYMHPMHQRNGFATLLYNHLEKNASSSGYWTIQAQLFTENTASKSLFESLQFRQVGIREKIGKYKDKWVDNYLYEKNI
jgi:phosphinothricin acetyltransferase|tara:strand:+ start:359 stop:850 length:492 start_codon:yes stop_codon:yes gene_type:complete